MNPPDLLPRSREGATPNGVSPGRLLELVTDSVIVCDSAGAIESWNDSSQRIYG
ncbi:MAG: PAS domain-containing protein [Chthoniobacterales bacterium]